MLGAWKQVDMASESPYRALLYLAVPLMISLFFQNLYSFANTIFVSWLGERPLAAISLAVPLTYIALSLAKGVAMGSAVLMGHARGAGNNGEAEDMGRAVLPLMMAVMSVFLPLLWPAGCRWFYQQFGASTALAEEAYWFTFWLVLSFPAMGYAMAAEAQLMAQGDTVTPMKGMIIGNVVNLLLDPLLIFVLNFGLTGAGMATLAGQVTGAMYLGWRYAERQGRYMVFRPFTGLFGLSRRIIQQGAFVSAGYLVSPAGLMLMNGILSSLGEAAIGAWNMMSRIEMMVMLPVMGIGNALALFTGYNLGMGRYDRIRQCLVSFGRISWSLAVPAAVIFLWWPEKLLGLFNPGSGVAELAAMAVRASAVAILFIPVLFAFNGLAQGLKKPVYMVLVGFCYIIAFRVPLAWLGSTYLGAQGVFWAHPAAAVGAALLSVSLVLKLLRQTASVADSPSL